MCVCVCARHLPMISTGDIISSKIDEWVMDHEWDEGQKHSEKNPVPLLLFVHHKSHIGWPEIQPGAPR